MSTNDAVGLGALLARGREDPLTRNSFYIMLATATTGALGFVFWLLCARIFTPSQIGVATTLISATTLIAYLSLLGFNTTFIRFLPTAGDRDAVLNTGLPLVLCAAIVGAGGYLLAAPLFAHQLRFVERSPLYGAGFVALTAAAAINLVTDSVFIAYREARYNVLIDGLIQGGTKLVLPLLLVGAGSYGIFASSGLAALVAASASLFVLVRRFSYQPRLEISAGTVREIFSFSATSYVVNLANLTPVLVLPLVVIARRGAAAAGYYYVAFQIAGLLYAVAYAVAQSLLAEGSYDGDLHRHLVARSAKIQAAIMLPGAAVVALGGPWILRLFGGTYSHHAAATLAVFALAGPAVAASCWVLALLRLTKQLGATVLASAAYALVTCGLAVALVGSSLAWVAGAWLAGQLASVLVGGVALVLGRARRAERLDIGAGVAS